ncbi:MAG: hypothetical protein IPJ66_11740 [Bacteroidetes bacterium]|nr:hypothetical protein [Bacteroidota bacterium]
MNGKAKVTSPDDSSAAENLLDVESKKDQSNDTDDENRNIVSPWTRRSYANLFR